MMKHFIGFIILISISLTGFSQRASFEKKEITVGDQIDLKLEISADAGKNIQFPVFDKFIIPGIEIIKKSKIQKDKKDNFLKQTITVTAFEDSLFLIKGLKFIVNNDTFLTNPIRLKVNYFKPDSEFISKIDTTQQLKISDIKPPADAPMTFKEFMQRFGWYLIIALIVSILIIAVIKFLKKRKRNNEPLFIKKIPIIPAHIKAIERINELKNKGLHKNEDLKPFYSQLSNIIRLYIEERFHIPALESVTNEIIEDFDKTEFGTDDLKSKLRELLSLSDTVKFAKNKPAIYENEIMTEYALSFVNNTKEEEKAEEIDTEQKENY